MLSELFREARKYGTVNIFTSDDGTYSCTIKFNTVKHISLEAKSGWGYKEVEIAITKAIENAKVVVRETTNAIATLNNLKQLR